MKFCRLKKMLVRDPETIKTTHGIPWNQELRDVDSRYLYGQYPEFEAIKHLRDIEIVNPAPFSHRSLIEFTIIRQPRMNALLMLGCSRQIRLILTK